MTDQPPQSPFALNPARITLLVLGALAIVMIVGALLGGVGNYQALREFDDLLAARVLLGAMTLMDDDKPGSAARVPVIVLSVVLVVALILGIATGSLNERIWNRPPPSPSDPITIP